MNNESSLTPTIIIFIVIVAIVGGYIYMKSSGSTTQPVTSSSIKVSTSGQFENIATQLSSISFNTALFSNSQYTALHNINITIIPEPLGRANPFAPF